MNENQSCYYMSDSAFKALFYPLPAVFLDTNGPGMVRIDTRTQSVVDEFASPEFLKQSRLQNLEEHCVKSMKDALVGLYEEYANVAGVYSSSGGYHFGVLTHDLSSQYSRINAAANWAHEKKNVTLRVVGQILVLFSSANDAARYDHGVTMPERIFASNPTVTKRVEQKARREFGVQGLTNLKFRVRQSGTTAMCTCAVQNVYFMISMSSDEDSEDIFVSIAVKAIVHLYRQLVHYRSTAPNNLVVAPSVMPPDPDMCAYCGTESSTRMHCSQCKMLWYCSPECQTKHWKMKGPFSHRCECKRLCDPSVVPPAIPLGRLVMIHSLSSAAGQRLNGKDAIVVTQPTDNGRLGVVLEKDVSAEDAERLKMGNVSWVPTTLQKAIKTENLELVWTDTRLG